MGLAAARMRNCSFITAMLSDPTSGLTVIVMLNNSTSSAAFAQALAMELTAIASTFKAATGQKAPRIALPWTTDDAKASLRQLATCLPKGSEPTPPAPSTPTPTSTAGYRPLPSN